MKLLPAVVLILIFNALPAAAQPHKVPLPVESQRWDLQGVRGRIDHMAVDLVGKRLFINALGNNSVEILNLHLGHVERRLELDEPQGALFIPESGHLVVTSGSSEFVQIFDASFKTIRKARLHDDNDNVRFDKAARRFYVGSGKGRDGALFSLDSATGETKSMIPLPGHPESFQLESRGPRIFVNVPSAKSVEVVDRNSRMAVASWPLDARNNYPMALDEANGRLFVGTRSPAKLVVLNTATGTPVASLASVGDADDIFYDARLHRIYVSGGEGYLYVFDQIDPDVYELAGKVATRPGARTSLFVPEWRVLFVAAPAFTGTEATLLQFDVGP